MPDIFYILWILVCVTIALFSFIDDDYKSLTISTIFLITLITIFSWFCFQPTKNKKEEVVYSSRVGNVDFVIVGNRIYNLNKELELSVPENSKIKITEKMPGWYGPVYSTINDIKIEIVK